MKPVILCICFLSLLIYYSPTKAQNTFAPVGAEWHHTQRFGTFHEYVLDEGMYHGKRCRRIVQKAYTDSFHYRIGIRIQDRDTLYVYNNEDTVFIYNQIFSKFTPLYIFNVNAGDTITTPVLETNGYFTNLGDSTFSIVIDSVKMVLYDTTYLKTVFSHSIEVIGKVQEAWFGNCYIEKLGSVETAFWPGCKGCVYTLSDIPPWPNSMRCYRDNSISIQLTTGDCLSGIPTNDISHIQKTWANIIPNPAGNYVTITSDAPFDKVYIVNTLGQTVYSELCVLSKQKQVNTAHLPNGLYIINIVQQDNVLHRTKLQIQH